MTTKRPAISDEILPIIADVDHPLHGVGVVYEQTVEWGDMDAFNHVNNVVYYDYAQRSRIHYLEQLGLFDETTHTVIAASSCQYIVPVTYPDTLWIGVRAKKIGNTSLTHEYLYFSTAQKKLVAKGESVMVFFDDTGENKTPINDNQRKAIENLELTYQTGLPHSPPHSNQSPITH